MFLKAEVLELCDIIDTPGISDPNMAPEIWQRAATEADGVLWLTHATQAWRQSEAAVWESMAESLAETSLLLVTRIDKILTERDRMRVLARVRKETDGEFRNVLPISVIQALAADGDLEAWQASGGEAFSEALLDIIAVIERRIRVHALNDGSLKMTPLEGAIQTVGEVARSRIITRIRTGLRVDPPAVAEARPAEPTPVADPQPLRAGPEAAAGGTPPAEAEATPLRARPADTEDHPLRVRPHQDDAGSEQSGTDEHPLRARPAATEDHPLRVRPASGRRGVRAVGTTRIRCAPGRQPTTPRRCGYGPSWTRRRRRRADGDCADGGQLAAVAIRPNAGPCAAHGAGRRGTVAESARWTPARRRQGRCRRATTRSGPTPTTGMCCASASTSIRAARPNPTTRPRPTGTCG